MQNPAPSSSANVQPYDLAEDYEEECSAVSWPAIFGGAFAALALSLILIGFGSGLGLASFAGDHHGMSYGKHLTWMAAAWLIITQWISSGLGGYLTGRLRTKWIGVHSHEVFFRDTAHGFITWAVTTVTATVIVFLVASSAMHGHMQMMKQEPNAMAHDSGPAAYDIDLLFRRDQVDAEAYDNTKAEATPILMHAMADGTLSDADRLYLAQLVATHTGIDQTAAQQKVDQTVAQMRQTGQEAEKAAASFSILTFLAMLIGAFVACVAAALGGHERDLPYPRATSDHNF